MIRRQSDSGQSAVEFALILPILVLILMGIFDFGRAFYAYSVVANSAREGARAGIYGGSGPGASTDDEIRAAVRRFAIGLNAIPDSDITIVEPEARMPGEDIQVTVRYTFVPVTPLIDSFLPGGNITLVGSSIMHVE